MALGTVGLRTAIWNNNLRSLLLLALYPLLLTAMVWAVAGLAGYMLTPASSSYTGTPATIDIVMAHGNAVVAEWWPLIFTVVAAWFIVAFFFHGRMVRSLSQARPVTRAEEPALYNLLENLCISRGLPMPTLNIIETDALNAFASGIDRRSYSITVTRGLMKTLADDELEAVLGHELTHIINNDVRLLIVSVIFTGMIGFAAQFFWRSIRFHNVSSNNRRGGSQGLLFMLLIAGILMIGYGASLLTRFALSRRREFMADAGAVELTRDPDAMIRALRRIAGHDRIPGAPADIALMCIENSAPFLGLFATHPPIPRRIAALEMISGGEDTPKRRNPWR